eukprot:TRINITY_DN68158_c1_g2_i2.p1 TRINITY_DN68158_c1_g2~~TRINITY_DN68158_c1_g2_i2.p1  ORF type:complete len:171 (+),score=13.46 TRINITY_DN68158_c1_g2_i2:94-606(+)
MTFASFCCVFLLFPLVSTYNNAYVHIGRATAAADTETVAFPPFPQPPIIILGPGTQNGGDGYVPAVTSVTTNSFDLTLRDWKGDPHTTLERLLFMAISPGAHLTDVGPPPSADPIFFYATTVNNIDSNWTAKSITLNSITEGCFDETILVFATAVCNWDFCLLELPWYHW